MSVSLAALPHVRDVTPPPTLALDFVQRIAQTLERLGADGARLDASLGIETAERGAVPIARIAEALDGVAAELRLPHLAIEIVKQMPLGALGSRDLRFSSNATLGEALPHLPAVWASASDSLHVEIQPEGDTLRVTRRLLFRPTGILSELAPCLAVRRLRDVLGEDVLQVLSVTFVHAARGPTAPYEEFFRAPVEFGGSSESVVYPRSILDAPLLTASPSVSRMLAAHPAPTASSTSTGEDGFVRRARSAIAARLGEEDSPKSVERVAGALKMSARTLQRKLSEHGTSYSALLDEVRREEAERLLAGEGVLLADVAFRLGFRNLNAFFRAFRDWTGTTPRQFQKAWRNR